MTISYMGFTGQYDASISDLAIRLFIAKSNTLDRYATEQSEAAARGLAHACLRYADMFYKELDKQAGEKI